MTSSGAVAPHYTVSKKLLGLIPGWASFSLEVTPVLELVFNTVHKTAGDPQPLYQ